MSILSTLKDFFAPAPSHEESFVIFNETSFVPTDFRLAEPDFDVYARPQALSAKFGQYDRDAPTAEEQRTGYRGLVSKLIELRARVIADALCRAEVKRQTRPKEYEDVEDGHPWRVLIGDPSPNLSTYDFWFDAMQMRDMGKGGFAAVGRNGRSIVDSLYLIYPDFGEVNAVPNTVGGIGGFVYTNNGGQTQDIMPGDMLWLRHRHPVTPYESASLLERAAFYADISLYQAIYGRDMTAEGNTPPVYAKFKTDLTKTQSQQYGEVMQKEYFTAGQRKRIPVIGSDGELKTLAINPNDLQYIEAAQLNDQQLMRIFGFPPAMFESSGVVANSEEVRKQWLQWLHDEVQQICSSLTKQFRVMFGAEGSDLVIIAPDIVPMSAMDKQRIREVQLRTGQRSINEFRMEDGMDEVEGGDKFYVSAGLQPIDEEEEEEMMIEEEDDQETERVFFRL